MNYRRFGRTGLRVSEVVFGGGYVGGLMILADVDTRRRVLRRVLRAPRAVEPMHQAMKIVV